jgi:hypothetical protein
MQSIGGKVSTSWSLFFMLFGPVFFTIAVCFLLHFSHTLSGPDVASFHVDETRTSHVGNSI